MTALRAARICGEFSILFPPEVKPVATFPTGARVPSAATHDAALVGDASGYIDPLTGEGSTAPFGRPRRWWKRTVAGWSDLPAALARYARSAPSVSAQKRR